MTDADVRDLVNASIEKAIPAAHRMGVRIVAVRPGQAVGEVPLEGNTNHVGTMYAGVLFTVAEILGGAISVATFDSSAFYPVVLDVRITFHRPATSAVRATASLASEVIADVTSEAEANGKAKFELEAELTDSSGETVATTHGLYQLRKHGA